MIYDYANQYWDYLFNDGPVPQRTSPRVKLEQHLAWPETRIGNLLTWLNRDDMEGWDNEMIMGLLYKQLDTCNIIDEAHY